MVVMNSVMFCDVGWFVAVEHLIMFDYIYRNQYEKIKMTKDG